MPSPALTLWVDSARSALCSDWQSTLDAPQLTFRQGDSVGIELHWVKRAATSGDLMQEIVWPTSCNITMAIGLLDEPPNAGTFTLTYGGQTTNPINFDATATQLQSALNSVSGIIADGGVTVSKTATTYRIIWNNPLVPSSTISIGANDLVPTSTAAINTARTGSVSVRQISQLHIKQAPAAVRTTWVNQDTPVVTVTKTHEPVYDGDYRIWRFSISPTPKGGSFRLGGTMAGVQRWALPIAVSTLSAATIAAAVQLNVVRINQYEYEITQAIFAANAATNVTAIAADGSGLIGFSAKYGVLSLNTMEVELLLNGNATAQAILEIEVDADGSRQTIVQTPVTITNDLIDTDAYTLVQWGEVIPLASVVRFDTSQTLTSPQKAQALTNIGALGSADISGITTTQNGHDARIGALEALELTTDQRAAITGASLPSATNVFATASGLAGKAATSHTHTIANVTGLQTALDTLTSGKLNVGGSVPSANVIGLSTSLASLQTQVDGKAPIGYIPAGIPTANQQLALNASVSPSALNYYLTKNDALASPTTQSNPNTGNLTQTIYPLEVTVVINGTTYAVPARIV